jgi:hypothetical protein
LVKEIKQYVFYECWHSGNITIKFRLNSTIAAMLLLTSKINIQHALLKQSFYKKNKLNANEVTKIIFKHGKENFQHVQKGDSSVCFRVWSLPLEGKA